jgi:hypothetical protein
MDYGEAPVDDDDNVADANTYEALSRTHDPPAVNSIALARSSSPPSPPPSPHIPDHLDYGSIAADSGCESSVFIDLFPSRAAGAPITSRLPSHSDHVSNQESPCNNIWAPFLSQCDWEVAHWAKTQAPTSSAVAELFAIPEVCISKELMSRLLKHSTRSPTSWGCHITTSNSLTGSLTKHFPDARLSSARLLTSVPTNDLNSIIGKSYHVSRVSSGTLDLHMSLSFPRSVTTPMQAVHAEFSVRCTQQIGGGRYRYVMQKSEWWQSSYEPM